MVRVLSSVPSTSKKATTVAFPVTWMVPSSRSRAVWGEAVRGSSGQGEDQGPARQPGHRCHHAIARRVIVAARYPRAIRGSPASTSFLMSTA